MSKTNEVFENAREIFDHAIMVLHPANSTSTFEEKEKAITDLQQLFGVLHE